VKTTRLIKNSLQKNLLPEKKSNMPGVRCAIKLLSDKTRKVDIEIHKEKNGQRLWSLIKSVSGILSLPATTGTWETSRGDILALSEHNPRRKHQDLVMLIVWNVKQDFVDQIINNGKTFVSTEAGLYNDNPAETEVVCAFMRMF
jgi:hypothetical protein